MLPLAADEAALLGALRMAELGFKIVDLPSLLPDGACTCRKGSDCSGGKHPRRSYSHQTDSLADIIGWALSGVTRFGVVPQAGQIILDRDGPEWPEDLASLPATLSVATTRGEHRYFTAPEDLKGSRTGLWPQIDLKAIPLNGEPHSLVVAPGSLHRSGKRYAVKDDRAPAPLPDATLELVQERLGQARQSASAPVPPEPEPSQRDLETAWDGLPERPYAADLVVWLQTAAAPPAPGDGGTAFMADVGEMIARWPDLTHAEAVVMLDRVYNPMCDGLCDRWTIPELSHKVNSARSGPKVHEARQVEEFLRRAREHAAEAVQDAPTAEGEGDDWDTNLGVPEPIDWLVESLRIERGAPPAMFVGDAGSAKSFAGQSLLVSLACGEVPWCGGDPQPPMKVGHVDFEQGEATTKRRYRRLLAGRRPKEPIRIMSYPSRNLTSRDAEEWLTARCAGLDLVMIDPLRDAVPGVDENDSNVGVFLKILARVSQRVGCGFLVLHHTSKVGDIRGSTAIRGSLSTVLRFARDGLGRTEVTWNKVREGSPGQTWTLRVRDIVDRLPTADGYPVTVETVVEPRPSAAVASEARLDVLGEKIKEVIRANSMVVTGAGHLKNLVGGKASDVQAAVERLVQQGWIKCDTDNRLKTYRLLDEPVPDNPDHLPSNVIPIRPEWNPTGRGRE